MSSQQWLILLHKLSGYIIEWLEEELTKNTGVAKECTSALDEEAEAADSYVLENKCRIEFILHNISSASITSPVMPCRPHLP